MEYYVSVNNSKRGPYSIEELRARGITSETLVMAENSTQWLPAWQVEELRPIIRVPDVNQQHANASVEDNFTSSTETNSNAYAEPLDDNQKVDDFAEAVPLNDNSSSERESQNKTENIDGNYQQGRPVYPPHNPEPKHKGGCMSKFLILLLVIALIVVAAIVTCPDAAKHKAVLTDVVSSAISDEANVKDSTSDGTDVVSVAFRQMNDSWTKHVVAVAVDNLIHVDNHIVYSVGKVRFAGKEHTVSVGVFGHVFTVDKDDLRKAAEGYYDKAKNDAVDALKKKASQIINDNIIDPAENALFDVVQQSLNELEQDLTGSQPSSGEDDSDDPTDSVN